MVTGFATLFALVLMPNCPPQQTGHSNNSCAVAQIEETIERIVCRIEGTILGCLIRKGMNTKEVSEILPDDPLFLQSWGSIGGVSVATWEFYSYGVIVSFVGDNDGALRVQHVSFFACFY